VTWRSKDDLARETGAERRELVGKIRKTLVSLSSGAVWQFLGALVQGVARETFAAEVWQGIGFASRPRTTSKAEALLVYVGRGARQVQAVAMRDEDLRRVAAANLEPDETAIFSSKSIVVIKADGSVEIRSIGGTPAPLALKSELAALRTAFLAHTHVLTIAAASGSGGTGTAAITTTTVAAPVGTTVLKAE